jgi:hypothetical protein
MRRVLVLFLLWGALATAGFTQTANNHNLQNLRSCLAGFGDCDRSLLTSTDAKQIDEMQRARNLWECLRGYGGCDHSLLNEGESKEVAEAERLRNLLACETTLGIPRLLLTTPLLRTELLFRKVGQVGQFQAAGSAA